MKESKDVRKCKLCGAEFFGSDSLAKVAIHRAEKCPKRDK